MHFSCSLLRFERLAPSHAIQTSTLPIKYIRVRVKLSHNPQSRAYDIAAWGGCRWLWSSPYKVTSTQGPNVEWRIFKKEINAHCPVVALGYYPLPSHPAPLTQPMDTNPTSLAVFLLCVWPVYVCLCWLTKEWVERGLERVIFLNSARYHGFFFFFCVSDPDPHWFFWLAVSGSGSRRQKWLTKIEKS